MSAALDRKLRQAAQALAAGENARAEELSREVLERAPHHPRALHLAAAALLRQGDGAGARTLLQRLLAAEPGNLQAMEDLGAAALKDGDFATAETWLRRAIQKGRNGAAIACWL